MCNLVCSDNAWWVRGFRIIGDIFSYGLPFLIAVMCQISRDDELLPLLISVYSSMRPDMYLVLHPIGMCLLDATRTHAELSMAFRSCF